MRVSFRLALWFGLALAAPALAATDVDIAAPDGFALKATYYEGGEKNPGILLLHQCNQDRHGWGTLAEHLRGAGFHVLTLDFRGFGESTGDGEVSFKADHDALWPKFDEDVDAALQYLVSQPGIDGGRLGTLGASCGGSQALLLANRNDDVKTAVLLSSSLPWISEVDIAAFDRRKIPVLGIAAEKDATTADMTERIFHNAKSKKSRLVVYKGDLHGTPLFEHDPDLESAIVQWFALHL